MLLCERGAELVEQFDALFEDLQRRRGGLVGTLKINAPLGFGRRHLAPVIGDFQQQNPDIDVALTLSDRPLTETMDRFDIVVHIGELPLSNLVGYAIAPNARFVCAAPALLKRLGTPDSPDELSRLPCIVLRENNEDVSLVAVQQGPHAPQRARVCPSELQRRRCDPPVGLRRPRRDPALRMGRGRRHREGPARAFAAGMEGAGRRRDGAHASARGSAGAHPTFHAVLAEPIQAAAAVAAIKQATPMHGDATGPTFSFRLNL